ncbi:unannotated protein [freshwater metagenome]|uniref:Unannotated protein n=1 Tax=freshwater metagenome TaxID=449393 RepID=A0A6J7HPH7_9ZZZZ
MDLRLPQLVARDDEVLAKHGDVDSGPHGVEVCKTSAESPLLSEDADAVCPARLVVHGQRSRTGDLREGPSTRTRALHLGDDRDTIPLENRVDVTRGPHVVRLRLELLDRNGSHSHRKIFANASDDVVQDCHDSNISHVAAGVRAVASSVPSAWSP